MAARTIEAPKDAILYSAGTHWSVYSIFLQVHENVNTLAAIPERKLRRNVTDEIENLVSLIQGQRCNN